MKTLRPLLIFIFVTCFTAMALPGFGQVTETHNFITYDSTYNASSGNAFLFRISRPANADTSDRPAIISMNGAGESGSVNLTNRYGPGYWLEQGWDGSIQLGNGKHYPIIITIQPVEPWPQTADLLKLLNYILSAYHIKKNAVHVCGLGMGAFAWSSLICHQSSASAEDGMKLVTSLTCLQGQSNVVSSSATAYELPGYTSFGHWAKKYKGKFFGLEGTLDYRNVGAIAVNMNDSVSGSAYFSYEKIDGGGHSSWNAMYSPSATNWTATGSMGPNNATGAIANTMGTYKGSMNLFQWMLRQGDTSIVVSKTSTTAPVVDAGGNVTTYLPINSVSMAGSATSAGGTIASYYWTKVSGPAQYTISNLSIRNPVISNLVVGNYVFRLTSADNLGQASSSDVTISVNNTTSLNQSTTPSPIPGKIEAESYYAMSEVGTLTCNDDGGGLYVGAIDPGDWMNYYVNVATAQKYTVTFRVACGNNTPGIQLRQSDGTVLGSVTAPKTANFTTWETISTTVVLPAGKQYLQIFASGKTGFNINWMQFAAVSAAAIPGKIEAENYDAMSEIRTQTTTDAGGGSNVGSIDKGDWVKYNVNVAAAGQYSVNFRIATAAAGASFQVKKSDGTVLATLSLPNTGGYQTWQTVGATITLPAGAQTLQLVSTTAVNWNFNWMDFIAGSAKAIPGTVEAEDYSLMTGVESQVTTDAGGGRNVGWIDPGDWMNYSVTVAASGTYMVNFRVASPATGAGLQLRKPDGTVFTSLTIPNTGNYQAWQTVSAKVTLAAGTQTLVVLGTGTASWNLNWIEFVTSNASAIPGKVEAENYETRSGTQTEATTDAGGGDNVGSIDRGDWLNYNVNVASAGTYTVGFRVASPSAGATFQLKLGSGTVLTTVTVPKTGNYQTWQTVSATVTLPAGNQTLQIYCSGTINWNFNWMQFTSGTSSAQTNTEAVSGEAARSFLTVDSSQTASVPVSFNLYPNPVQDHFSLDISNAYTGGMNVLVVSQSGTTVRNIMTQKEGNSIHLEVNCSGLAAGIYFVRVQIGSNWSIVKKVVKF